MSAAGGGTGLPQIARAHVPGGWLVASRVQGGWSIAWVPSSPAMGSQRSFDGWVSRAGALPPNAPMIEVTPALLDTYLGKRIDAICGNNFINNSFNHCAHFVNHVMQLDFKYSCANHTGGRNPAGNLRVHETFARCGRVGLWPPPPDLTRSFAFITAAKNVDVVKKKMQNVPRKHIGIFCDGSVWHYSNTRDRVVRVNAATFAKHFGPGHAMFYGEFPTT